MAYKVVGADDNGLFPTRVMNALRNLFPQKTDAMITSLSSARKTGSIIGWAGDSHTVGTGASNASYGFRLRTSDFAGGFTVSYRSINGGVTGENSGQLLARIPGIISSGAQTLFVLIGTNDIGQGATLVTFQANLIAIKTLADQAGLGFIVATVPPRASAQSSAEILRLTSAYNLWIRSWAAANNIVLADFWSAVVDTTSGLLRADYSSDGIHVNDLGHIEWAKVATSSIKRVVSAISWPVLSAGLGLTNDPLAADSGQFNGTHWDIITGYYAELAVYPLDVSTTSVYSLPAGRWIRFQHNNASTTDTRYSKYKKDVDVSKFAIGDRLLFLMYARASDAGVLNKLEIRDGSGALAVLLDSLPIANPGPVAVSFTIPATKPTALQFSMTHAAPPGKLSYVDLGAVDVLNLTTLGVTLNGM